jgi:hypothetical protein
MADPGDLSTILCGGAFRMQMPSAFPLMQMQMQCISRETSLDEASCLVRF